MSEQPLALRLADLLNEATTVLDEPFHHNAIAENLNKAAAELRRLHEENERLNVEVESWRQMLHAAITLGKLCDEWREENERMREALSHISLCSQDSMSSKEECGRIARAALRLDEIIAAALQKEEQV